MTSPLDALAERYGIAVSYRDMSGRQAAVPDDTKRSLLAAMGVPVDTEEDIERALATAPSPPAADPIRVERPCFVPEWLAEGRCWGVALQLYQLRSARNWGIGDFADLSAIAPTLAAAGADFIGTNPLHALFTADPERASPFSPSSRLFLNPLAIAVDQVPGFAEEMVDRAALEAVRATELVDYTAVARLKLAALKAIWPKWRDGAAGVPAEALDHFAGMRDAPGPAPYDHALFEELSHEMVAQGHGTGWPSWPEPFRDRNSPEVARFAESHRDEIAFHEWLQFLAAEQLDAASEAARAAGMRIGLYLDLAVGNAPDGSATWNDPALAMAGARVGAPPDFFSPHGQDWGLAPLSPALLRERDFAPFRDTLRAVLAHAGAVRIDHAMGIMRIFLIPDHANAIDGAYVAMPMAEMLAALAELSHAHRAVIIGEDLGVVPEGFREIMHEAEIQSYRVLCWERDDEGFRAPDAFPATALACLSTHDMPPIRGWWEGEEIATRTSLGMIDEAHAAGERRERERDRGQLLDALVAHGMLDEAAADAARAGGPLDDAVDVALHRYVAATRSRLVAVRLEDLSGERALVNLPGTDREHPNWRRRLPVAIEEIAATPLFSAIVEAVAGERPKPR